MVFKSFKWETFPSDIKITMSKHLSPNYLPNIGLHQQMTGQSFRIIEGTSEFYGPDSSKQFESLSNVFMESSSGQLLIPPLPPIKAFFSELSIISSPSPDIIAYKFKFIEDTCFRLSSKTNQIPKYYFAKKNESLWDIANKFDIKIDMLLKNNPSIPSPYDISTGDKIKL